MRFRARARNTTRRIIEQAAFGFSLRGGSGGKPNAADTALKRENRYEEKGCRYVERRSSPHGEDASRRRDLFAYDEVGGRSGHRFTKADSDHWRNARDLYCVRSLIRFRRGLPAGRWDDGFRVSDPAGKGLRSPGWKARLRSGEFPSPGGFDPIARFRTLKIASVPPV